MSSVIRVFGADLARPDPAGLELAALEATLPPAERTRSASTRRARALTRGLLARELGVDPTAVQISRVCTYCDDPVHGRPHLAGGELSFNVSHSGDRVVIAVGEPELALGVDLELVRPRPRLDALARRVLDDAAYDSWLAGPEPERLTRFLRAWTAKEAYLKAVGLGIATALRDVPSAPADFTIRELECWTDAIAAVAVDRLDAEVVAMPGSVSVRAGTAS